MALTHFERFEVSDGESGVGTSEFFLDRIGRLKIFLDRIGRLKFFLDRIGIGSVAPIFLDRIGIGSVDSKKIGSERDRVGIESVFMKS